MSRRSCVHKTLAHKTNNRTHNNNHTSDISRPSQPPARIIVARPVLQAEWSGVQLAKSPQSFFQSPPHSYVQFHTDRQPDRTDNFSTLHSSGDLITCSIPVSYIFHLCGRTSSSSSEMSARGAAEDQLNTYKKNLKVGRNNNIEMMFIRFICTACACPKTVFLKVL